MAKSYGDGGSEPCPADYLRLRAQGLTIQAIAEHWHFATRRSVYWRIAKWRALGLLETHEDSPELITRP